MSGGFRKYKDDMASMLDDCESNLGQLGIKVPYVVMYAGLQKTSNNIYVIVIVIVVRAVRVIVNCIV